MATTLADISIKDSSRWNTYLNLIYPIGTLYFSYTSTSPASRFGGSWSAISGNRYLRVGNSVDTGGNNSHTHPLSGNGGACIDYAFTNGVFTIHSTNAKVQASANFSANNYLSVSGNYAVERTKMPKALCGNTDSSTITPLYQTVYCWRRTA